MGCVVICELQTICLFCCWRSLIVYRPDVGLYCIEIDVSCVECEIFRSRVPYWFWLGLVQCVDFEPYTNWVVTLSCKWNCLVKWMVFMWFVSNLIQKDVKFLPSECRMERVSIFKHKLIEFRYKHN